MPADPAFRLLEYAAGDAVERARSMDPGDVIALVERAGLRGRGGAGQSTALKMAATRTNAANGGAYVVANAYDGDPGSPLARTLVARNVELVRAGMAIAAHAVGAETAYLYLHPEATEARAAADGAAGSGTADGLITTALGPGTFMGGEETALLAVLESRRAMARQRPPWPAQQGLLLRPTLISSAETIAALPFIVNEGPDAFRGAGTASAPGTKLVSVTGAVANPGVHEVPFGTRLGDLLDMAGGPAVTLKGIHVGGPTGGILGVRHTETPLGYEELKDAGTHLGSAQVRAIPADACIVREAAKLFAYLARETCAICVPCRVGTKRVQGILDGITSELGRPEDLPWLTELGDHMREFSMCGFGITAPSILRTTMAEFPDDYRAHIEEQRCPVGTCTPLRARRYETMAQP
ncbi:MAG: NADH-ubiquinone oxidoreductase-F iron-sulfur binding region domain-containing protein [Candidatus Limnocylindria bacterium]